MLKITFLVGNGFDLALGIKSSYYDFYHWYIQQTSDMKHIIQFKNDINDDIGKGIPLAEKKWVDFEVGMGRYTEKFTPETAKNFIDCYTDAQEGIAQYIKQEDESFDVNKLSADSLQSFSQSMLNFFNEVSDVEKIEIKSVFDKYKTDNREISIVTLNYSSVLDRIIDKLISKTLSTWIYNRTTYSCKINPQIIHAHGSVSRFPIIGVNDESQIANKALLTEPLFKELMIKEECIKKLGELWYNRAEQQIDNSKIVCVFGCSLGPTDAKWWRKLMTWLKGDSLRHLIIHWYEKKPPNNISIVKRFMIEDDVKKQISTYSNFKGEEIELLKRRIHIVINTECFLQLPKEIDADDNSEKEELTAS